MMMYSEGTYLFEGWEGDFGSFYEVGSIFGPCCSTRNALLNAQRSVIFHCWNLSTRSAQLKRVAPPPEHAMPLKSNFWLPSWCKNWAWDISLEILSSLLSKISWIFQFGAHFPCQNLNLPRLVKMCRMRLQKCRGLWQSTIGGLPQLQIELMINHWKYLSF